MADVKGQRIKALRREHDMTQDDLAEYLNVSRQAIHSYENEKGNPEIPVLIKLAETLSCSVDYLLGMSDNRLNSIDEDDRAGFDDAMRKHSEAHQKIAFSVFTKIMNSTAEYHNLPYVDKPLKRTMLTLESIADYNAYIQQIPGNTEDMTKDEAIEANTIHHALSQVMITRVNDLVDIGIACIAAHSPKAYTLSKQIYGIRDNDLDLDETVEIIKKMRKSKLRNNALPL